MTHRRLGPPPLAVSLLSRRLETCAWRDSILGDLDEEHAAITRRRSRLAADLFYWTQAVRLPRDQNSSRLNFPGSKPFNRGNSTGKNLRGLMSELTLAIRSTFKQPAHTALVVGALSLGLGLNAAVFGMGDALLLRPFPYPGIDRVVVIGDKRPEAFGNLAQDVSPANYLDWRAATVGDDGPFDEMVAWEWWNANLTGNGGHAERVQAFRVSPGFFNLIGVPLATGREFAPGEDVKGRDRVVVIGSGLWQRRFGADPAIVGTTLLIDQQPHTIIGIAAPKFTFPNGAEAWIPLALDAEEAASRTSRYLTVGARLNPGATLEDARARLAVIAGSLKEQYPAENGPWQTQVELISNGLNDPGSGTLILVWQLSALLVLLIACANAASLLLARGAARTREIAVRLALGASRWRLIRQMLLESVVLAMLAVPVSLAIAWGMLHVLKSNMPAAIVVFILGWDGIGVDARLVLFTIAGALAMTIVFGLIPAIQSSSLKLVDTLKEGTRGSTAGRLRLRRALVTAQIALALPLLVAAGMTALGTYTFLNGPQGYDPDGVLSFRVALPEDAYAAHADRARFVERAVAELATVPGTLAAAATNVVPSSNGGWATQYEIHGEPLAPGTELRANLRTVTPEYFGTMRQPIHRGRGFTSHDREGSQQVALVSESFAARHWPNQDPLGRQLVFPGKTPVTATVVGVAGNFTHDWFQGGSELTIYRPTAQRSTGAVSFVMRTAGDPTTLAAGAREAMVRVDPHQPIFQVSTQRDLVHIRTIGPQYAAAMMAVFGALALLLSAVGIYALVGYYVQQRRQEIGVRMALGAARGDIVRQTLRQAATMAALGVVLGSVAAFLIGRALESGFMGIAQQDHRLLAGFALTLTAAALVAGYLPARRAAGIDPIIAMRND